MNTKIEDLRTQLAEAEAAQRAEYEASLGDLHRLQDAWRKDLVARGGAINDDLEAAEAKHTAASREAGISGDLNAAYAEYIKYHASRRARGFIRNQETSAAEKLGETPRAKSDLALIRAGFADFIESVMSESIAANVTAIVADYVTPMPTEAKEA